MERTYSTERLDGGSAADLRRAADLLRAGETVAFPTETVYGLGANALDPEAVERIFVAKQRPHWDPLIVHVSEEAMLARVAAVNALERQLIDAFWPGPLTLLLARTAGIPDIVTAGRPRVGVRMPAHPVARKLIELAGVPIAAPSANRFGHTSPTSAKHVLDDLDCRIAAVVDGGETMVGLESTVAEVSSDSMERRLIVYRPGAITVSMLEHEFGLGCVEHYIAAAGPVESLPSPGVGLRHYAPHAPLILVEIPATGSSRIELSFVDAIDQATEKDSRVGIMLPDFWDASAAALIFRWGEWGDSEMLAHRLFEGLRALDLQGATKILCPVPPPGGLNDAIRDRLLKARAI